MHILPVLLLEVRLVLLTSSGVEHGHRLAREERHWHRLVHVGVHLVVGTSVAGLAQLSISVGKRTPVSIRAIALVVEELALDSLEVVEVVVELLLLTPLASLVLVTATVVVVVVLVALILALMLSMVVVAPASLAVSASLAVRTVGLLLVAILAALLVIVPANCLVLH